MAMILVCVASLIAVVCGTNYSSILLKNHLGTKGWWEYFIYLMPWKA
jgi:hypothetical protein